MKSYLFIKFKANADEVATKTYVATETEVATEVDVVTQSVLKEEQGHRLRHLINDMKHLRSQPEDN